MLVVSKEESGYPGALRGSRGSVSEGGQSTEKPLSVGRCQRGFRAQTETRAERRGGLEGSSLERG